MAYLEDVFLWCELKLLASSNCEDHIWEGSHLTTGDDELGGGGGGGKGDDWRD